jgi:hypothetical protein
MDMPKPSPEHRRLEAFVGVWVGTETCHPSPWDPTGGPATGRFTYSAALDGFFLLSDYRQERPGGGFIGHGVYGFDPESGVYTMDWFDSMGSRTRALGRWDVNALVFENRNPTAHARYVHRLDGDEYLFRLEISQDGATWKPMLEGQYRRG